MLIFPKWKENKIHVIATLLLLASIILYLGVKIDNTIRQSKQIGQPTPYEHTILVEGEGKAVGKPDIATLTMGTESKGADVATAQQANNTIMNKIIDGIKALEISEDDIQTTGYNIYEDTEWNEDTNKYETKGWIVSNYVVVKIRDTAKLSTVLTMAGQNGITNISGPTFTIDDTSNLKAEARAKAIEQAQAKAREIATSLGMKIEKAVGYSEWSPTNYYDYGYGLGGSYKAETAIAPAIETGTNEETLNVTVTYKLVE